MSDLDALLAGIVADPHNALRWLIVADWLDDHDQPERAELLRLHRELIRTCCEPDAHPERAAWQARIVELIDQDVTPCVPQHTLMLPGGVPLVGNFIPPGSFLMGSEEAENEKPIHKVTITKGFFLGIFPVTQLQAEVVVSLHHAGEEGVEWPEYQSAWDDAVRFCVTATERIGCRVRLPTEAEWEYACRAGTTTQYHWGETPDTGRMNCRNDSSMPVVLGWNQRGRLTRVGAFAPNPWGLFDCHGNVWEWCNDLFDLGYYRNSPLADPHCQHGGHIQHALRGGGWTELPEDCRAAIRDASDADSSYTSWGFRVVFTLP